MFGPKEQNSTRMNFTAGVVEIKTKLAPKTPVKDKHINLVSWS